MKSWIKIISGILLTVTGIFAFLFFRNYKGDLIPDPLFWYIAGILLAIGGLLVIKGGYSQRDKRKAALAQAEIDKFKLSGDKILVDLNSCKIKTNNYTEQIERRRNYRAQALDEMYDSNENIINREVNQTVLVFESDKYGTKKQYYSRTIFKDEITLRFLLDKYKETYIYVDKNNRDQYYFDIEFLNDKK